MSLVCLGLSLFRTQTNYKTAERVSAYVIVTQLCITLKRMFTYFPETVIFGF